MKVQLDTIYPYCNRISVLTQYDRDWYGNSVIPDKTVDIILNYPDSEGKIHLVVRRFPDEAAARNMEMLSFCSTPFKSILTHGRLFEEIKYFHQSPDYFWIIDADEIYDTKTIPAMLNYLSVKRPKGMRVTGYNYLRSWNQRIPRDVIDFTHFGFIKPGVLFTQRRVISWNESRLSKLFRKLRFPDMSSRLFGFITCPEDIAVFHHGCWLGDNNRIYAKFRKSSHAESKGYKPESVDNFVFQNVHTDLLPDNIRNAQWPEGYLDA